MIVTQKITTLAFQIHDGEKTVFLLALRAIQVSGTPMCLSHAVQDLRERWQALLSLVHSFQASVATPFCFPNQHSSFFFIESTVHIHLSVCSKNSEVSVYILKLIHDALWTFPNLLRQRLPFCFDFISEKLRGQ